MRGREWLSLVGTMSEIGSILRRFCRLSPQWLKEIISTLFGCALHADTRVTWRWSMGCSNAAFALVLEVQLALQVDPEAMSPHFSFLRGSFARASSPTAWSMADTSVFCNNSSTIESFGIATAQSSVHKTPQIFNVVKHMSGLWPHGRILSGAPQTISFVCSVVPVILSLESQRLKVVSFRIVAPTWWTPALSEGSPQGYLTRSSSTLVL